MPEKEWAIEDIIKVLPHRYPFLLVDRILELEVGVRVLGLKNVSINEHFFQGHFPSKPVMPGVLIIETMAQVGGVLAYATRPYEVGRALYFVGMDKVKFRRPVVPGDQLMVEVEDVHHSSRAWKMRAKATVEGQLCAQADLTAALGDPNERLAL
jgi:beta-hydroxyacyl-ACP dehydratase FabZ